MLIRTKKLQLTPQTYIKLGFFSIVRQQWWILLGIASLSIGTALWHTWWFVVVSAIGLLLYFAFWGIQLYGMTLMEENKLFFERVRYEISSQQLLVQLTAKRGAPISWNQIQRAKRGKQYILLMLSKIHFIYLPDHSFNSTGELQFLLGLLRRKKLL